MSVLAEGTPGRHDRDHQLAARADTLAAAMDVAGVWPPHCVAAGDAIYIPVIMVDRRGQGIGGRWLDSLPTDVTLIVPNVMNPVLEGVLERRGFVHEWEWAELGSPIGPDEHGRRWLCPVMRRAAREGL
jgi:hypothetical protein